MPGTPTVELTDTNETITLAQGIRRKQITLTAHRTKTLSKSGASEGDTFTIDRTNSSSYLLRLVDPNSGEVFCMGAPGRVTLRLEGGNGTAGTWKVETSNLINGSKKINAKHFGAVGDGVTDDTAALQAFFDVLSNSPNGRDTSFRYGFIPAGQYKITSKLYLKGNNSNSNGFYLEGESFSSQAIGGTIIEYSGADTDGGAITFVGVSGSVFKRINVDAGGKAEFAGLATLATYIDTSSENVVVEECMFYNPRNMLSGAAWGHGNTTEEWSGGSDVAYWTFRDCKFYGNANSWNSSSYLPQCFYFRQSNNVLVTRFERCFFNLAKYGVVNSVGSNLVTAEGCDFNLIREWAIIDCGWSNCYRECYCEGSGGILAGSIGNVTLERCRFNVNTVAKTYPQAQVANEGIVIAHPKVRIIGGYYREFRHRREILSVDTVNNKITVGPSAGNTSLVNGDYFWLWADGGEGAQLQVDPWSNATEWETRFYVNNISSLDQSGQPLPADTYRLDLCDSGLTAFDIIHAGIGTSRTYTRMRFNVADLHIEGADFDCTTPVFPAVYDQGVFVNDGNGSPSAYNVNQMNITLKHCRNGQWTSVNAMAHLEPASINPRISFGTLYSHRHSTIKPGLDLVRTTIWTISALRASRVTSGATLFTYAYLPARARIVGMQMIVEEAFAASGLASATCQIQLDPSLGGTTGDLMPASNLMAVGGFGYTDDEFGTLMKRANLVHGGYIPAGYMSPSPSGATWPIRAVIDLTGAGVQQLTAGKLDIYIKLELLDAPNKLIGFDNLGSTGISSI